MLPEIQTIQGQDRIISQFLGLNQTDTSNDESFRDMQNMTSDEYPYLAPRKNCAVRNISTYGYQTLGSVVYGEDIYSVTYRTHQGQTLIGLSKNFEALGVILDATNTGARQLAVYGAYIVIFPDNVMYNTETEEVIEMTMQGVYGSTHSAQVYLSDANGVPFICNEYTQVQASEGSSQYWNGLTENIAVFGPSHTERANSIKIADIKANSILNNYTQLIPSFIPSTFAASYEDNTIANLRNINLIISNKNNLKQIVDDSHFNCFTITKSKNGKLSLVSYNPSMSAFMPVDNYITLKLTTTDATDLEESIKPGDYVEIDMLNSSGEQIEENQTKDSWYKLVKKFNNKVRIEKVLRNNNDIGFVIKADDIDFLEMLKDAGDRMNYRQIHDYSIPDNADPVHLSGLNYFYGTLNLYSTSTGSLCSTIRISKTVPQMDYITVSQNRIWGCSSENHEIYACKQGDATAWYNYAGLSSDSYAVTIPNGDKFTGAVTYSDMPYFFTENMAYSIMGNKPKNYQVQNYELRGVEDGAYRTIAQKDGYVYYKSKSGIERFNGNNAQSLTEYLDLEGMNGYIGQTNNDKYFVFLGTENNTNLYVYDIKKRLWHKERNDSPNDMVELDNNLYITENKESAINLIKINGKSTEVADILVDNTPTYDTPKWWVESGEFNGQSLLNKYITKFMFEMKLEQNAKVSIYFMYDDSGEWEEVFRTTDKQVKKLINVPILVRRCERMRYKIKGEGQAKIYSISITSEGGSEING